MDGGRRLGALFTDNFNRRLALSVTICAISSANYGIENQGFSAAQALDSFTKQFGVKNHKGKYHLQAYWLSLYSSVIWAGFAVGIVVGSWISNRYGRRFAIFFLSLWSIISTTVIVSSFSKWQVLAGRIMLNGYLGMELAVLPVQQAESVPVPVRSLVVSTYQFSQQVGGLIMNLIFLGTQHIPNNAAWRIPFALFYVVPLSVIAGIYWVPESPRWLLLKDRPDEAYHNLKLLREGKRTEEEITAEFKAIEIALREEPEQGKFVEIFYRDNVKQTLIACGMNWFQETSGQQITAKFGALLVKQIGGIDPFIITVIFAVVGIVVVFLVGILSDRFGRKPFLLSSIVVMCISCFGLGAIGTFDYKKHRPLASAAIFFLVFLSFGFSLGLGPLTNVIMTEVTSLRLRDSVVRSAGVTRGVANFIVGFTLPYELDTIGLQLAFIYGSMLVFAFAFVFFCVPECKGKSLELVEHLFRENVPIRKFGAYQGDIQAPLKDGVEAEEIAIPKALDS